MRQQTPSDGARRTNRRGLRRVIAMMLTALAAAGIIVVAQPGSAWALGAGKYCLYLAPAGADNLGHVGWEVEEPGKGYWAGSTETSSGDPSDTWIYFASSEDTIHGYFKWGLWANGKLQHSAGYYTEFRCHSTSASAVGAAIDKARELASGYELFTNNCLTKSVAIFTTYWDGDHLAPAAYTTPKDYYYYDLPTWGPEHLL